MIPKDKFGNPIHDRIFRILKRQGDILISLGYKESKKKPNLFFIKTGDGIFFADMRGTEEIPIWRDSMPLFYWRFEKEYPDWKNRRIIREMLSILAENECPCRLSFMEECEPDGLFFEGGDGYCKLCGKDFRREGEFCSKECEQACEETYKGHCAVCGKSLDWKNVIQHHVSYNHEKIIPVCKSCHLKIHRGRQYPKLKSREDRI